jgi:hypothetical protein
LEKKPEDRITIKALLELPWMRKSDDELEEDINQMIENLEKQQSIEETKLSQSDFSDGKKQKLF